MAKIGRPMNRETMEDEIAKGREEIRRNGNENWKLKHILRQQRQDIDRMNKEIEQLRAENRVIRAMIDYPPIMTG